MADDDEPVPRIPHPRGFRLSTAALVRIGLTGGLLVLVIAIQRPCADSVSKFVTSFGDEGSAAARMPKPGTVEEPSGRGSAADYEPIRAGMTEAEIKAAIERSKAKAAERAAAERAAAGSAGSAAAESAGSAAAGTAGSAAAGSATP
jgi:hypothetical protein